LKKKTQKIVQINPQDFSETKSGSTIVKDIDRKPPEWLTTTGNKTSETAERTVAQDSGGNEEMESELPDDDSDDDTPKNVQIVENEVEKPYYSSVIFRADAEKPVVEWSTNLETDKT